MRFIRRLIFLFLLLVIVLAVAIIVYIRPNKEIDMSYQQVDMKVKVWNMVKTQVPEIELSEEELNNLAKKKMIEYLDTHDEGVKVTGADFSIHGQEVEVNLNGKWSMIPFGVTLHFHMEASGDNLILEHQSTSIKQVNIPLSRWALAPITFSLKEQVPDIVEIDQVNFNTEGVVLTFAIDWSSIPQLLLDLK